MLAKRFNDTRSFHFNKHAYHACHNLLFYLNVFVYCDLIACFQCVLTKRSQMFCCGFNFTTDIVIGLMQQSKLNEHCFSHLM